VGTAKRVNAQVPATGPWFTPLCLPGASHATAADHLILAVR
jgi:hypothetical protein